MKKMDTHLHFFFFCLFEKEKKIIVLFIGKDPKKKSPYKNREKNDVPLNVDTSIHQKKPGIHTLVSLLNQLTQN